MDINNPFLSEIEESVPMKRVIVPPCVTFSKPIFYSIPEKENVIQTREREIAVKI